MNPVTSVVLMRNNPLANLKLARSEQLIPEYKASVPAVQYECIASTTLINMKNKPEASKHETDQYKDENQHVISISLNDMLTKSFYQLSKK